MRLKERPLAWDAFQKRACSTLARGTTREHQSILELITLFSSLVFDTVATPLHQLGIIPLKFCSQVRLTGAVTLSASLGMLKRAQCIVTPPRLR